MKKIYDKNGDLFAELNYSKEYFLDYSRHSHDSLSICVFGIGEVEVEFHNREEELVDENQIIIFNPNQVHQTKSERQKTKDYFTLHVDTKWCKDIQNRVFGKEERFIDIQNIISDEILKKKLFITFQNIIENSETNDDLENYIIEVIEKYTLIKNNESEEENHLLCIKLEKFILDNLEEQITLEDMAKEVGYNESYVSRVFKEKYGLSPYAFLVDKRVQKAKNMLVHNNKIDLAKLSNKVGFYDQSHFSKAFKRTFATTPNKYKKSK